MDFRDILTVAAGQNPGLVGNTWNPSDKAAGITLTNGNLTATGPAGGAWNLARGTKAKTTGKRYFEATIGAGVADDQCGVGVADANAPLTGAYLGSDAHGIGYIGTGAVYYNGGAVAAYTAFSTGAVIGVAVDLGAETIWFAKNGVFNGDPAGGTGGKDFPLVGSPLFPAFIDLVAGTITGNFGGSAFTHTVPTGFVSWDS